MSTLAIHYFKDVSSANVFEMSDPHQPCRGRSLSDFFCHLVEMPRWHKRFLILASVLFGSGLIGQGAGYFSATPTRAVQPDAGANSSFVRVSDNVSTRQAEPTVSQKLSPHATRIGVSFIVAFVLGWIARAFLKIAALVASLGAAAMFGLSYLGIVNIDFSSVQHQYDSNATWLIGQIQHLSAAILGLRHYLPSSVASGAGMWVGFRRR